MKYSELFTKGNGIFATVFKTEYPTEYAAIFGDTDPTKLDAYALLQFGGKTVVFQTRMQVVDEADTCRRMLVEISG